MWKSSWSLYRSYIEKYKVKIRILMHEPTVWRPPPTFCAPNYLRVAQWIGASGAVLSFPSGGRLNFFRLFLFLLLFGDPLPRWIDRVVVRGKTVTQRDDQWLQLRTTSRLRFNDARLCNIGDGTGGTTFSVLPPGLDSAWPRLLLRRHLDSDQFQGIRVDRQDGRFPVTRLFDFGTDADNFLPF